MMTDSLRRKLERFVTVLAMFCFLSFTLVYISNHGSLLISDKAKPHHEAFSWKEVEGLDMHENVTARVCRMLPLASRSGEFHASICTGLQRPERYFSSEHLYLNEIWKSTGPNQLSQTRSCLDGYILLEAKSPAACTKFDGRFSFTQDTEDLVRESYGPDSFSALLSGPEQLVSTNGGQYMGNCRYIIPFYLHLAGTYKLRVEHWRKDFESMNDMRDDWPPLVPSEERLLVETEVQICPEHAELDMASMVALQTVQHEQGEVFFPAPLSWRPQISALAKDTGQPSVIMDIFRKARTSLPLCDMESLTGNGGLYVLSSTWNEKAHGLNRTLVAALKYVWMPLHCRSPLTPDTFLRHCSGSKKTVLFLGDSHLRNLFVHALNFLGPSHPREFQLKNVEDEETFGSLRVKFVRDILLENWDLSGRNRWSPILETADVIFFNCGAWPGSTSHWPTSRYLATMQLAMTTLSNVKAFKEQKDANAPMTAIWVGLHPFTPTDHPVAIYDQDRRTLHRLDVWNKKMNDLVLSQGLQTLMPGSWFATLPFLFLNPDNCHYHSTSAMQALVSLILRSIEASC